jgi:hypothetical protein
LASPESLKHKLNLVDSGEQIDIESWESQQDKQIPDFASVILNHGRILSKSDLVECMIKTREKQGVCYMCGERSPGGYLHKDCSAPALSDVEYLTECEKIVRSREAFDLYMSKSTKLLMKFTVSNSDDRELIRVQLAQIEKEYENSITKNT